MSLKINPVSERNREQPICLVCFGNHSKTFPSFHLLLHHIRDITITLNIVRTNHKARLRKATASSHHHESSSSYDINNNLSCDVLYSSGYKFPIPNTKTTRPIVELSFHLNSPSSRLILPSRESNRFIIKHCLCLFTLERRSSRISGLFIIVRGERRLN